MTAEDALAEGITREWIELGGTSGISGLLARKFTIEDYADAWDACHTEPGTRWEDNPMVWAVQFEIVSDGEKNDDLGLPKQAELHPQP